MAERTRGPDGPPAGIVATVSLALTVAGLAVSAALGGGPQGSAALGGGLPASPLGSTGAVAGYYLAHPGVAVAAGVLAFGASVPLGIYAATVHARLLRLGVRVPGPHIAYFGGISAAVLAAVAGLLEWVIGQPVTGQSPAVIHTLAYAVYALGGVGQVGGIGLLVAGIAVPSLLLRLTPRWLAWLGLVLAGLSELGFVSLVAPVFSFTLPVGRLGGLLWLVAVGFTLPHNRNDITRSTRAERTMTS